MIKMKKDAAHEEERRPDVTFSKSDKPNKEPENETTAHIRPTADFRRRVFAESAIRPRFRVCQTARAAMLCVRRSQTARVRPLPARPSGRRRPGASAWECAGPCPLRSRSASTCPVRQRPFRQPRRWPPHHQQNPAARAMP